MLITDWREGDEAMISALHKSCGVKLLSRYKPVLMAFLMLISQQAFCEKEQKADEPAIYMNVRNADDVPCVSDTCAKINLNIVDFSVVKPTLDLLYKHICSASDKISSYSVSVNISGNTVIVGGSGGISVDVSCK